MMVKNACVLIETEVRHIQTGPQVTLYDYHLLADRQETGFHGFKLINILIGFLRVNLKMA